MDKHAEAGPVRVPPPAAVDTGGTSIFSIESQIAAICTVFVRPQVEKAPEGAGPLRTVKSDGQADERPTAVVNSVSSCGVYYH